MSNGDKINSFLRRGEVECRNTVKVTEMISMLEIQYMFPNRITRLNFLSCANKVNTCALRSPVRTVAIHLTVKWN